MLHYNIQWTNWTITARYTYTTHSTLIIEKHNNKRNVNIVHIRADKLKLSGCNNMDRWDTLIYLLWIMDSVRATLKGIEYYNPISKSNY